MKLPGLCLAAALLACSGCAINPVSGEADFALMSEAEEIEQGRKYHDEIIAQYGVYDDPELQKYVNRIGQALAKISHRSHLEFSFTVLDTPDINAFALPGGYIYITRGLMAYLGSEAELAGVLGHEIGHVTARHSVRQQAGQTASGVLSVLIMATTGSQALGNLSQSLGTGLVRGYGREHELEADRLGAEYLHAIGYDPDHMLEVIGVLKDQEVFERKQAKKEGREPRTYHGVYSTHPRNDERLQTVVRKAKDLSAKEYRDARRKLYYKKIDGMVWGPSPKQGLVRANRFAHPELGFSLALPRGWNVINTPEVLIARDPDGSGEAQLVIERLKKDESLAAFLRRFTGNGKLEVTSRSYGATAKTAVRLQGGSPQPARLSAIRLDGRQVLTLIGTASDKQFAAVDKKLLRVNSSFERLDRAAIDAIEIPRLRIIARGGNSFEALAKASAIESDAESKLRLLNRLFPRGNIRKLDQVKTVTYEN